MKETASAVETATEAQVHPLQKSYMFVSTKHVDYENLEAFEALTMTAVLVLAVIAGTAANMAYFS